MSTLELLSANVKWWSTMTVPLANVQFSPFSVPQVTVETYNHCNVKSKNLKDDRFPISRVGLELVREVWVLQVSLSFDAGTRSSSVQTLKLIYRTSILEVVPVRVRLDPAALYSSWKTCTLQGRKKCKASFFYFRVVISYFIASSVLEMDSK